MKADSSSFDDILNEADEVDTEAVADTPVAEDQTTEEALARAEPVEEVVQTEGYSQDARGVWHRADGTIASKAEVEKFGAAAAPEAQPKDGLLVPAAVAPEALPFSFKSQGQEIPLEGASLDKDGNLVVSKSGLANVQQMLARASEFPAAQSREARTTNERDEARRTSREAQGRAEQAEFAYQHLAAILDSEERLAAFLTDPREKDFALRELQLGIRNAQVARATADRQAETQAQTTEQTTAQELETIASAIQQVTQSPEMQALAAFITPEDIEEATAYFKEMRGAIVRTAEDDSFAQYGIQKGEKYVTHQPMQQYLKRIATERKTAKEALAAATQANRFNQSQTIQKPQVKRPALVAAAPAGKAKPSWDQQIKDAFADDDED